MADPASQKVVDQIDRLLTLWNYRIIVNDELVISNSQLVDVYA